MGARTDVEGEPGTSAISGALLVATKLARPPLRSEQIGRDRLVGFLQAGTRRKLTLLAAPPGFGKTTLLSEWLEVDPRASAWLWLDEADNDPARFFAYVIESLRTIDPGLGTRALAALRAPGAGLDEVV